MTVLEQILSERFQADGALEQAAREQQAAAASLMDAAAALIDAAGTFGEGAGGYDAGAGSDMIFEGFGGNLSGLFKGTAGLPSLIRSLAGGKTGKVLGAATSGAMIGAKAGIMGAVLGGVLSGGIAAALTFGLPALFGGKQTPAQRSAEIESIIEGNRFNPPDSIEREIGFGSAGIGEFDLGAGDVPRVAAPVQVHVNVSAMDSRSFLDRAPEIASAVRKAMLDMHPINQMVKESF